jgi:hypothetical protein
VPNLHDLDLFPGFLKRLDEVLRALASGRVERWGGPVKVLDEARSVR